MSFDISSNNPKNLIVIAIMIFLVFNLFVEVSSSHLIAQNGQETRAKIKVAITCNEDEAEVIIDGKSHGKTKDSLLFAFLKPGKYSLTISKPGFETISKNVQVTSNKYHFDFELIPGESKQLSPNLSDKPKNDRIIKSKDSSSLSRNEKLPESEKNAQAPNKKTKQELGQTPKFVIYEDPPVPIKQIAPQFTDLARRSGTEGQVWLEVELLKNGDVGAIKVKKSLLSGPGGLDQAAIEAVKQWKYKPARSGGKPVACWITFPVTFELH